MCVGLVGVVGDVFVVYVCYWYMDMVENDVVQVWCMGGEFFYKVFVVMYVDMVEMCDVVFYWWVVDEDCCWFFVVVGQCFFDESYVVFVKYVVDYVFFVVVEEDQVFMWCVEK